MLLNPFLGDTKSLSVKKKSLKLAAVRCPEKAIRFFGGCILETVLEQSQPAASVTLRGGSVTAKGDVR